MLMKIVNALITGLAQGSMIALVALGYTMVYGILKLINFAHSEVFMAGAFGSYLVVSQLAPGEHGFLGASMIVLAGLLTGAIVSALIAWTLELVAYKPLRQRGAPKLAFLISAIGMSFFLVQLFGKLFNRFSGNPFPENYLDKNAPVLELGGVTVTRIQVIIIVAALLTMILLDRIVNGTKLGRSIRAVAEDAPTAALMGINIDRTISRTFLIGGALAGVAGFLFGQAFGFGNTMGFDQGVKAFAAAVLGGIGNLRGAMMGGLLLGIVEAIVPPLPFIGIEWTDVVAFVVLVAILVFRPTGLLGEKLGRAA